jgi:hypothetical protein
VAVVIRCPHCKTKFRWLAQTDAYPKDCPECGAYVGHDRADDDVVVPNILAFSTRCQDGVYKAMEKASEQRVYEAAEMAGCSPSEMSSLKITNMRDNVKPGETSEIPVRNAVTDAMDRMKAMNPNAQVGYGSDNSGTNGSEFARAAASGYIAQGVAGSIMPHAGARAMSVFNQSHASREEALLNESHLNRGLRR